MRGISIAKPLDRLVNTYQRSVLIETGVAGGIATPLLELEDDEELLLEELEDELLLELLEDELLELLEELALGACPPHAPTIMARTAAPITLINLMLGYLIDLFSRRRPCFISIKPRLGKKRGYANAQMRA